MARSCTVCVHPDRPAIDQALVNGRPFRNVAERFAVSVAALFRHRGEHLPAALTQAHAAEEVAQADDLLSQVTTIRDHALRLLGAAEAAEDFRACASLLREARGCVELLGELMSQIDRRPTMNVLVAPEWLATRSAIVEALAPYPEARAAVAARMLALETTA